jgi:HK97 family phage prohead protease
VKLAGYAALFGRRDAGRDLIRHGAFTRTLADRRAPVPLYWQHQADKCIGWIEHAAEDGRGLRVVAGIDNPDGVAGLALRRGAVTGLSFGYCARAFRHDEAGRELLDIDLIEVSLVTHARCRREAAAPPPDAVEGSSWLVAAGATGAWTGKSGTIACRQAGNWLFVTPRDGLTILYGPTGQIARYRGTWLFPDIPLEPIGGSTVDSEARTAISQLLAALRVAGIFPDM